MSEVESFLVGQGLAGRVAYSIARTIVAVFLKVWCRMRVDGRGNLPSSGAYIVAPVHRSVIDTPIASGLTRRRMRFMGKDSMWRRRPIGWFISALGAFPVSRGTPDREALRRCIAVLSTGEPLVLFPEGERKQGPIVQPLFDGAAYVAVRAGVPIVPVGIGGSQRVMPKGAWYVRPRRLHVIIGEPIQVRRDPSGGRVTRSAIRDVSGQLHAELQRLYDAAQARVS